MARPPTQVTGGTGALGLVFAEWMASLGARPLESAEFRIGKV